MHADILEPEGRAPIFFGGLKRRGVDFAGLPWRPPAMALDYNNLPLLMTIDDLAEVFRCSSGTIRRQLHANPTWLRPVNHGVLRRPLFATVDVMAHLGHAAPAAPTAPLKGVVDPWVPEVADDAISQTETEKKRQRQAKRDRKYIAEQDAFDRRMKTHRPTARAFQIGIMEKVHAVSSDDGESFRIKLRFQPRFRPEGWPAEIPIPRGGPEWIRLASDAEMKAIQAEIREVMAEYRPQWERMRDNARRAREAAKGGDQ